MAEHRRTGAGKVGDGERHRRILDEQFQVEVSVGRQRAEANSLVGDPAAAI